MTKTKTKKKGWIHICKYLPEGQYVTDGPYYTKQLADFWKPKCSGKYIDTIEIEWEEEV